MKARDRKLVPDDSSVVAVHDRVAQWFSLMIRGSRRSMPQG